MTHGTTAPNAAAFPLMPRPEPFPFRLIVLMLIGGVVQVMAWLSLLLLIPGVREGLVEAETQRARVDLLCLDSAIKEYAITNGGRWPTSLAEVPECASGELNLRDPWGHTYRYKRPAPGEYRPTVYSLGSDGILGGTGPAADVTTEDVSAHSVAQGAKE